MTGCGGGCGMDPAEECLDPSTMRKISKHPCFSKKASHKYGRIHLPVAPDCNIQCNFCLHEFDCVNESRPGVTSQVLTSAEALERVKEVMGKFDNIRTIGIAGPSEPMATVMIPTVNDHHIADIARKGQELGAFMHNIMPLIPQYKFAHLKSPTAEQRKKAQDESEQYIRQMRHCRQCRADAVGLLGKDLSKEMFSTQKTDENKATTKVALRDTSKDGSVDTHFGHARNFLIFGEKGVDQGFPNGP